MPDFTTCDLSLVRNLADSEIGFHAHRNPGLRIEPDSDFVGIALWEHINCGGQITRLASGEA